MILVESSILIGSHRHDLIRFDEPMIHRIRIFLKTSEKVESQVVVYVLIAVITFGVTKDSFELKVKSDRCKSIRHK